MKKIRVQSKMSKTQAILFMCLLTVIFISGVIYLVISAEWAANRLGVSHTRAVFSACLCIIPCFLYAFYQEVKKDEEFVSELQLTDNELSVVYRNRIKITKITKIKFDNIKKFHAELTADTYGKKKEPFILPYGRYDRNKR